MKIRICKLDYHIFGVSKFLSFVASVKNGIYTNPTVFITPPYTEIDFDSKFDAFAAAANDYIQYGITKKTVFLEKKAELMKIMDNTAIYVNSVSVGDVSIIALSGFVASKDQFQRVLPLEKISNFYVKNVGVSIASISNKGIINYGCVIAVGGPLVESTILNGQFITSANDPLIRQDFNKSRRKTFNGLTPGTPYYIYVYANNSIGVSPLSDFKMLHSI
jgi:hypothetical protein